MIMFYTVTSPTVVFTYLGVSMLIALATLTSAT
jgi:hypothetical protein